MSKRVLDVGQCVPDHAALTRFLRRHFDVEVGEADSLEEALEELRASPFDLVLVNRKLDADYSDGLHIVKALKADPELARIPVMLVSNYRDAQESAVAAGAEYGFGKMELDSPDVVQRLAKFLGDE